MNRACHRAHTAFPGGSARDLRVEGEQVRFAAIRHDSLYSMWWQLALEGPGGPVRCVWETTDEVLGGGRLDMAVPVYAGPGGLWRRVDPRSCRHDVAASELRFTVPTCPGETRVAYCYPYDWGRVEALAAEMTDHPAVTGRESCRSEAGRPFRLIEVGSGGKHVWLTARHHAGETPGSYVLEGLLREVLRHPRWLSALTFHLAPVMDVDGVAEGWYGKERAPRDYNRDYCARPCRPEVAALMGAAEACGRADVMLDLHAPAPGDPSFLAPDCEPGLSPAQWQAVWRFAATLEALTPRSCPVRVMEWSPGTLNWTSVDLGQWSTGWFHQRFGALTATLETTYHYSHDGRLVTPRGWLALGRALARALAAHFGLAKPPDISHIPLPASSIPRFTAWRCVHWPDKVTLKETGQWLTVASQKPGGRAWMFAERALSGAQATFRYRFQGRGGQLTVHARGYDPDRDLSTGDVCALTIRLEPTDDPQTARLPSPDLNCQLFFLVEKLDGQLAITPGAA